MVDKGLFLYQGIVFPYLNAKFVLCWFLEFYQMASAYEIDVLLALEYFVGVSTCVPWQSGLCGVV